MDKEEQQQSRLSRYLGYSSALHLLLFASLLIGEFFSPAPLSMTPAIHVDVVALPGQVKNLQAETPDLSLPVRPEPLPEKTSGPEPEPEVQQAAEEQRMAAPEKARAKPDPARDGLSLRRREQETRRKAREALERTRRKLERDRAEAELRQKALLEKRRKDLKAFEERYREAVRGNQVSQGNSLSGEMQSLANAYVGAITDRIRANWALPSFLQDRNLSAYLLVLIDARGNVVRMQFTKLSGNSLFDSNAEAAVRRASPFPPPPSELSGPLRNSGIEVRFPL